jgi:splicing factor 3B subunit 4
MSLPAPPKSEDRNQEATIYVGNLDERVTESLLWELFLQVGPVVNVFLPKDRISNLQQGYGFVEFMAEEDADYSLKIMNMVKLFGKPIRINKAAMDKETNEPEVGATLFIGNLDPMVDEKLLYDTFSAFGPLLKTPVISRDTNSAEAKGYGFIYYDNFESSDAAIEAMHGQYLMNRCAILLYLYTRCISVQYAMKKDGKERHGTAAGIFLWI